MQTLSSDWSEPVLSSASGEAECCGRNYDARLSTLELISALGELLAARRRTERLICRYLADLADRIRERRDGELCVYVDEYHAARCHFGLGVRNTRERVRVGRALRSLPQVEQAFIEGQLSYSRVREITRIATTVTEVVWLELAQTLDMRSLERRVAAAQESSRVCEAFASGTFAMDACASEAFASMAREGDTRASNDTREAFDGAAGHPLHGAPGGPDDARGEFGDARGEFGDARGEFGDARGEFGDANRDVHAAGGVLSAAGGEWGTADLELGAASRQVDARRAEPVTASNDLRLAPAARVEWTSSQTVRVTLELTAAAWALFERAMAGARQREGASLSDGEALEAVARDALSAQNQRPDSTRDVLRSVSREWTSDVSASVSHELTSDVSANVSHESTCDVSASVSHGSRHDVSRSVRQEATSDLSASVSRESTREVPAGVSHGSTRDVARSATHLGTFAASARPATPVAAPEKLASKSLAAGAPRPASGEGTEGAARAGIWQYPPAARVLAVMGRRGGWSEDALIEASGLLAQQVAAALTCLELSGRVRYRPCGFEAM
jgi:DprA/Smf-like nucleotide binding protein involved in DNA uptake